MALPTPLRTLFAYQVPAHQPEHRWLPGMRVRVPFRNTEKIGLIVSKTQHCTLESNRIKAALECLDEQPILFNDQLELLQFAAQYYHHPIGDVIFTALPDAIKKGKPLIFFASNLQKNVSSQNLKILNSQQEQAFLTISKQLDTFQTFLLQGVTGSGKTEVYLHLIAKIIANGGQALVLVPEIGLTPQTMTRFQNHFKETLVSYHSNLTLKNKLITYCKLYFANAQIVIGTRSALFLPMANLKLIIIDEEHDSSYKQQDGFRYHARDLAIKRAQLLNIPVILGTATPSLETYYQAQQNQRHIIYLSEKAIQKQKNSLCVIDIRQQTLDGGLSEELLKKIALHLKDEHQVLLFHNRRGFAPVMMCFQCAFHLQCRSCSTSLVWHHKQNKLVCHHCGTQYPLLKICPQCQQATLSAVGLGTERLEQTLEKHFPGTEIIRIDRDTIAHRHELENKLKLIQNGQKQILIGTQMMAKGHDFPNLTLVGIIDLDSGFLSADFKASELTGQLFLQVSGRAGRHQFPGEIVIQTRMPEHPLLKTLLTNDYDLFAKTLLKERKTIAWPPYSYIAAMRAEDKHQAKAQDFLAKLRKKLYEQLGQDFIEILGPAAPLIEKKSDRYRQQLLFSSTKRKNLHLALSCALKIIQSLKPCQSLRWSIDVDPASLS